VCCLTQVLARPSVRHIKTVNTFDRHGYVVAVNAQQYAGACTQPRDAWRFGSVSISVKVCNHPCAVQHCAHGWGVCHGMKGSALWI